MRLRLIFSFILIFAFALTSSLQGAAAQYDPPPPIVLSQPEAPPDPSQVIVVEPPAQEPMQQTHPAYAEPPPGYAPQGYAQVPVALPYGQVPLAPVYAQVPPQLISPMLSKAITISFHSGGDSGTGTSSQTTEGGVNFGFRLRLTRLLSAEADTGITLRDFPGVSVLGVPLDFKLQLYFNGDADSVFRVYGLGGVGFSVGGAVAQAVDTYATTPFLFFDGTIGIGFEINFTRHFGIFFEGRATWQSEIAGPTITASNLFATPMGQGFAGVIASF